ncbi:hypothetical protein LGM39_15170 [Burkholderia cepacia]|uniref:hypothetical protein n=1 Tax=Burkholderia cepacia TaxID=292 RepID=UPI001CF35936|nr:hypothetical protein [Burkholderia cepacia]MCA7900719.1 hypothetical protein [Burkholderia cepacia]
MSDDFKRIPTSAEVYAVLMARHKDQMSCYGSFSDPDGMFNGGPGERGRMHTLWALADTDFPILEIHTEWEIDPAQPSKRLNMTSKHWLIVGKREA